MFWFCILLFRKPVSISIVFPCQMFFSALVTLYCTSCNVWVFRESIIQMLSVQSTRTRRHVWIFLFRSLFSFYSLVVFLFVDTQNTSRCFEEIMKVGKSHKFMVSMVTIIISSLFFFFFYPAFCLDSGNSIRLGTNKDHKNFSFTLRNITVPTAIKPG